MRPSRGDWPYNERSTRNCVHCKTCVTRAWGVPQERAYCGVGKKLGGYKLPLLSLVLKTATWVCQACRDCSMFDHDVPDVEPIL